MPKIKSLEELRNLREEVVRSLKVRESTGTKITIGMGTCGIAVGAKDVRESILNELKKKKIKANVISVGCDGLCSKEPLITIETTVQPKVAYGKISVGKVPKLIEEHICKGKIVEKWTLKKK